MNISSNILHLFTDKRRQTILALNNDLFRVKCWQCRVCTSGSPLFHSYRFYTRPMGSSPSCSRERNRTMLPFQYYYSYKGVTQIYFIRISLQHSNDNAILEGKQCCHATMLSKCENTTYLRKFDSITRKLAIVYRV